MQAGWREIGHALRQHFAADAVLIAEPARDLTGITWRGTRFKLDSPTPVLVLEDGAWDTLPGAGISREPCVDD